MLFNITLGLGKSGSALQWVLQVLIDALIFALSLATGDERFIHYIVTHKS